MGRMRFFDEQRVDAIGFTAVSLQKWLIFFAVCDTLVAILGLPMSIIGLVINLLILSAGFFGSLRRSRGLLLTFIIIRIIGVCLHVLDLFLDLSSQFFSLVCSLMKLENTIMISAKLSLNLVLEFVSLYSL